MEFVDYNNSDLLDPNFTQRLTELDIDFFKKAISKLNSTKGFDCSTICVRNKVSARRIETHRFQIKFKSADYNRHVTYKGKVESLCCCSTERDPKRFNTTLEFSVLDVLSATNVKMGPHAYGLFPDNCFYAN